MTRRMPVIRRALRALLDEPLRARADQHAASGTEEYDCFGASPHAAELALALTRFPYERWFRVRSRGAEHIPDRGPVVIAANHSGTLPFDAFMLSVDIFRQTDPPRAPRTVMDRFVPRLPFFGTLVSRAGGISGTRRNAEHILDTGQVLVVFPEGTVGIGKPFSRRYQLQDWRIGHAELALAHRAPVVPTAIVGAEEQMPILTRLDRVRLFGAPYLPIPVSPIPLPVRYHVCYGEPIALHEELDGDPRDPVLLAEGAARVKAAVQTLIDETLAKRQSVFG